MKVLVVGANGQIGKHLIHHAKADEAIQLTAMVRKEEQAVAFNAEGTDTVLADLEGSVEDLAKAMEGMDAVIFTAGSGGHTGADKTLLVDLDGAAKTVEAAERANVERYIMVSAFQAHNRDVWADSPIKYYMAAKHYADNILMDSKLNYTIIRPGGLINEASAGNVRVGELQDYGSVPREDVAKVILASLNNEKTYRKGFDLITGEDAIKDALNKL